MNTILIFVALIAFVNAVPILVEDEEGQQFYLSPVLSRQRRSDTAIQWFKTPEGLSGGGGAQGSNGGGTVSFKNTNGSGGSLSYGHTNGFGHDVKLTGVVPLWSNHNKYGDTTLNAGASLAKHYGGPWGDSPTDKQFLIGINHRF